jgi:hypothetical protein
MTVLHGSSGAVTLGEREGRYGEAVTTIEPGGAEFIPLTDRRRPRIVRLAA